MGLALVVYDIIFSPKFTLIIFLCTAQGWQFSNIISDHNAPPWNKPWKRGGGACTKEYIRAIKYQRVTPLGDETLKGGGRAGRICISV